MHFMQAIDSANLKLFVEQQFSLINELRKTYPELGNDKFLFSLPKQGGLTVSEEYWDYTKHGAGIRFIRRRPLPNIVIDAHEKLDRATHFDSYRISEYVESNGISASQNDVRAVLIAMAISGKLVQCGADEFCIG